MCCAIPTFTAAGRIKLRMIVCPQYGRLPDVAGLTPLHLQFAAWPTASFGASPTGGLRQWFSHDPKKWDEFRQRYRAELERHPEVCDPILKAARRGTVTLIYSSHDSEHNNAVALRDYLESRLRRKDRQAAHKSAA
jgi:uncharacterized protein YeaO (DUF488 family)